MFQSALTMLKSAVFPPSNIEFISDGEETDDSADGQSTSDDDQGADAAQQEKFDGDRSKSRLSYDGALNAVGWGLVNASDNVDEKVLR